MDKKQFAAIKEKISSFCKINFFQISLETKQATGIFCSVFTELKKDDIIERVQEAISGLGYPYTVSDHNLELTKHFIIRF